MSFHFVCTAARVGAGALLLAFGFAAGSDAADADLEYTRVQRLVEVEPGRRLNLYCTGSGSPTVVFESGLADPNSLWFRVQPLVAERTRTCSYDRAGVGFSDAGTCPGTSANLVADLQQLLTRARVEPPYLLVGQSSGGMNVRLYAYTHPKSVAALVLVDPSHEDQSERFRSVSPKRYTEAEWTALRKPGLDTRRLCIEAAEHGLRPGTESYRQCTFAPDARFTAPLKAAYLAMQQWPAFHQAQLTEEENVFTVSAQQLRDARRDLGDLPLVVLTRSPNVRPLAIWETAALRDAHTQLWIDLHVGLARESTRGVQRVVPESEHVMQLSNPQAVVDAVFEVLDLLDATTTK